MKNLNSREINLWRDRSDQVLAFCGSVGDSVGGVFTLVSPFDEKRLRIVASSGMGWDHVSVSRPDRCPNWQEMEFVKRTFFKDDETAMQLHVPPSEHVNVHPNCLHLWRPLQGKIPVPPSGMVG